MKDKLNFGRVTNIEVILLVLIRWELNNIFGKFVEIFMRKCLIQTPVDILVKIPTEAPKISFKIHTLH